ncbi:MAG: hypothetical protein J6Z11_12905 [Candidatus Riflebacteria bacterium]|nr:hypothetical protein [Candidatus Riflebacteria bacterium]
MIFTLKKIILNYIIRKNIPSIYERMKKELNESDNIHLFKITGENGDFFYIKAIEYQQYQYCMPIIPKKYYCNLPDSSNYDFYIKQYDPITCLNAASDYWISFMYNNFGILLQNIKIEDLGIHNQNELAELWNK